VDVAQIEYERAIGEAKTLFTPDMRVIVVRYSLGIGEVLRNDHPLIATKMISEGLQMAEKCLNTGESGTDALREEVRAWFEANPDIENDPLVSRFDGERLSRLKLVVTPPGN
jgi:hypothetical protein